MINMNNITEKAKNHSHNELKWDLPILGVIFGILLIFSYERVSYSLWDNHLLFNMFELYETDAELSLNDFSLFEHLSYSFTFAGFCLTKLFGSAIVATNVYGKLLLLFGGYGFYRLLRYVFKEVHPITAGLLTLAYCMSPYYLGLSSYCYPDYAIWCVVPLLTYFLYSNKSILATLTGLYFIFIKETALITFVTLVIAYYIAGCIHKKRLIHDLWRYILYAVPCVFWLYCYFYISHWNGEGGFGFSLGYAIERSKALFLINYNWVFVIAAVVGIIGVIIKKTNRKYLMYYLPTLFSALSYYAFTLLFQTINHARYIDALIFQIYFLAAFFVLILLRSDISSCIVTVLIGSILMISSYHTIDPLMLNSFRHVNVGERNLIVTTPGEILSDGMVYNREYLGFGYAVDMALKDIALDEQAVIFFPAGGKHNSWFFDAMGFYYDLGNETELLRTEPWNEKLCTRMCSLHDTENKWFDIHVIQDDYNFEFDEANYGYYIYLDCYGKEVADRIQETMTVLSVDKFTSRGWTVKRIKFTE